MITDKQKLMLEYMSPTTLAAFAVDTITVTGNPDEQREIYDAIIEQMMAVVGGAEEINEMIGFEAVPVFEVQS